MIVGLPLPLALIERKLVSGLYEVVASGNQDIAGVVPGDTASATEPSFKALLPGRYWVVLQCATNNHDTKLELVNPSVHARESQFNTIRFDQYMTADVTVNWTLAGSPLNYVVSGTTLNSWSKMERTFGYNVVSQYYFVDLDADESADFAIDGTDIETWQLFILRLGDLDVEVFEALNMVRKTPTKLDDGSNNVTVTRLSHASDAKPKWRVTVSGSPTNVKLQWGLRTSGLAFPTAADDQFEGTKAHELRIKIWRIQGQPGGGAFRLRWRRLSDPYLHDVACSIPTADTPNEYVVSIATSDLNPHYLTIEEIAAGDDCEFQVTLIPS